MDNGKAFEPVPFWFLNDDLDRTEILRQLDIMQKNGIGGFFMHVRDGILNQAYGTERFFEDVRFIVEEAKKRGLKAWIYDEDCYPSGNVGGQVAIERPELQARSLVVKKLSEDEIKDGVARRVLGKVIGLYGYAVSDDNGIEKVQRIENCFGTVRRRWYRKDMTKAYYCDMADVCNPHVRAATSYTEIMFEAKVPEGADVYVAYLVPVRTDSRYGTQINCLNKDAAKEFIARVHEKYAKYVGDYFGSTIPGIFMDEPSVGGNIDEDFLDYFKALYGYDFSVYAYRMCEDYGGDSKKVRRDYAAATSKLFNENFIRPIRDWCKEHDLLFTGHFTSEEDPLGCARGGHSVYRDVKELDIPGFDIISNNLGNNAHPSLILGSRIVASSAAQEGKNKVLAECFALNPFNFGYEGLKKIGDWLFVCGINWLVPHAFHYGYCAYQRTDAGKSFFFQDGQFDEYVKFSRYAGRVCRRLLGYESRNDILVVLPDGAFGEEIIYPVTNSSAAPTARGIALRERCHELTRYFSSRQTGWDVTDTQGALEGKIQGGKLTVGQREYAKIIVVKGGEREERVAERLHAEGIEFTLFDGNDFDDLPDGSGFIGETENLLALKKTNGEKQLLFLYRNEPKGGFVKVPSAGKNFYVYDAEDDRTLAVKQTDGYAQLYVNGYSSLMLLISDSEKSDGVYEATETPYVIPEYVAAPQWTYMPRGARTAIVSYGVTVEKDGKSTEFREQKFNRLRDIIGTQDEIYEEEYVIPYFDSAKRPDRAYPVRASYRSTVSKVDDNDRILFDGGTIEGNAEIFWNGKKIREEQIEATRVYDVKNYSFKPEWTDGDNVLEIRFERAGEFDGICGEIYVMKKINDEDNR